MAAITQIRYQHSPGRGYFDRKLAEGKTGKEALRCLKRQISDVLYARLVAGAASCGTPAQAEGPGGQSGNGSVSSAAGSHPGHRLFGQATPDHTPAYDRPSRPGGQCQRHHSRTHAEPLTTKIRMGTCGPLPGMKMGRACGPPTSVPLGSARPPTKIDAGALTFGCPPVAPRTRVSVS